MLLFYVRHGDPTYDPDELTPLGRRQAESVAHRLALYGIDKVFSSNSIRAMQTADPTCELLKIPKTVLPEFNEDRAYHDTHIFTPKGERCWPWGNSEFCGLLLSKEVRSLGEDWFDHPGVLEHRDFRPAFERVGNAVDGWLASLGYHHDRERGTYTVTSEHPDERIALFAHEGVGKMILSHLLDIPYPQYALHFEMTYTGMTVIEFHTWKNGMTNARVLTLSNDSHLYRDGLPLDYRHKIRF